MKKQATLLLCITALFFTAQAGIGKPDFKKIRQAITKSILAQQNATDQGGAGRATASRLVASSYFSSSYDDSTRYYYNNNYPNYAESNILAGFFDEFKFDSTVTYDNNGVVESTQKQTFVNQTATELIYRYGAEGVRYTVGYDAQGRFKQYTYDTLTTVGVWDLIEKAVITYNVFGKIDSSNNYVYVAGAFK